VTKSSTRSELVGTPVEASRALHHQEFLTEQVYDVSSAVVYQDKRAVGRCE